MILHYGTEAIKFQIRILYYVHYLFTQNVQNH